jgi:hypothetical protein
MISNGRAPDLGSLRHVAAAVAVLAPYGLVWTIFAGYAAVAMNSARCGTACAVQSDVALYTALVLALVATALLAGAELLLLRPRGVGR